MAYPQQAALHAAEYLNSKNGTTGNTGGPVSYEKALPALQREGLSALFQVGGQGVLQRLDADGLGDVGVHARIRSVLHVPDKGVGGHGDGGDGYGLRLNKESKKGTD